MPFGFARIRWSLPVMQALLAMLALVSQLALGSLVLPDRGTMSAAAEFRAATVLCRSASHGPTMATHPERHPTPAGAFLLDLALELPAIILPPGVILPPPRLPPSRRMTSLPPARAPPTRLAWLPRVRGPPRLA